MKNEAGLITAGVQTRGVQAFFDKLSFRITGNKQSNKKNSWK
jgi:hypothetical protein